MRRLPWLLLSLVVALELLWLVLYLAGTATGEGFASLPLLGYATVGAIVGSRDARNAIGWIFLALALVLTTSLLCESYVKAAEGDAASLAGGVVAAWFDAWSAQLWLGLAAIFIPLLFPDGRLPSRRWRAVVLLGIAAIALSAGGIALAPGVFDSAYTEAVNPVGIGGADRALEIATVVGTGLGVICVAAAGGSLVVRFRTARGVERQQVKWFALVAGLMVTGLLVAGITVAVETRWTSAAGAIGWIGAIGWFSTLLFLTVGIPATVAIAVFRYRLYDIDVVINRTLVYGSLTASLAGAYLGLVLLLQLAFSPLTEDNALAIAGSTLAVAALFRPARNRIQALVDRRFYRRKYDAARTLEAFSARLREEIELDALQAELTGVVRETMQPAHVSLWLRTPEAPR